MARILADLAACSATRIYCVESSASSLWDFAVGLYTQPGVSSLCLELQDKYAVNVNVLLFARWLETRERRIELAAALACVSDWDKNYVQVLRQLRRQMKMEFAESLMQVADVRDQIKRAELQAERLELHWLEQLAGDWPQASDLIAGQNIRAYLQSQQVPDAIVADTIASLIQMN